MYKLLALSAIGAGMILAQSSGPSVTKQITVQAGEPTEFGPIGITAALAGPMTTVAGAPYSAQAVTERVQVLADGNRIDQSTSGSVARDSQGRVRRDETLPGFAAAQSEGPHLIVIEDPVAGLHWRLDPQTKTAFKMQFLQPRASARAAPVVLPPPVGTQRTWFYASTASSAPSVQILSKELAPTLSNSSSPDVAKTDLGTQIVEGVPARGTRITRTLPAGAVGNEQPIIITTETWYSPDLKVLVMSKTDDPRMGETTYRLTNLSRSEPVADLFRVPDDYTVKDQPSNALYFQKAK